ncbi:response regulator [Marispirochaeta aestuarii]|uniref:hybrid sensor histidine kinase/response regulator n=1 Tax=Marispirochaeta aestuarii TaxID=1963862 RepID=UPI0029C875A5|nr:response regulator [Marispirochaeta aestuarii]
MKKDGTAVILVVEDESIVALDIKNHLLRFGYGTMGPVSSAEAAFSEINRQVPDLVLMDIKIHGNMDGIEASRIIREKYHRPVILLTAFADDQTLDRAKMSGPFGYILKPFNERELKTTIEMALYRHRMEVRLHESEERYRRLFEEDLSGDFIADGEGKILDCNPAFLSLFGFKSREDVFGLNINTLFSETKRHEERWEALREEGVIRLQEFEILRQDGSVAAVLGNMVGNFDEEGNLQNLHGYLIDTTEIKSLEEQLRQAQKMEAIGRMAGGIAHDFNNLLTVILGYITLVNEKYLENEPLENELEGIRTAAGKATRLTRQLLAFSRQQVLNPEVVDTNVLINDLEKMLRRLVHEDINLSIFAAAENPKVYVDPGQIEQVLLNLVVNARDAMGARGKLTIESRNERLTEPIASPLGSIPEGDYCVIEVEDNGKGIPEDQLSLIFEPFFTTKPADKGTGLGLSTVYGIVKQSRGFINVRSQINKGTSFQIFFPVTDKLLRKEQIDIPEIEKYVGSENILLVEDDNAVRAVAMSILKRAGYSVVEAGNAGEALLICEQNGSEIQLLITDYIMPHMTGDQLILRLRSIVPGLPSIIMSGYMKRVNSEKLETDAILSKPFKPEELLRLVRTVLDSQD